VLLNVLEIVMQILSDFSHLSIVGNYCNQCKVVVGFNSIRWIEVVGGKTREISLIFVVLDNYSQLQE
jgi:hypothetical protein